MDKIFSLIIRIEFLNICYIIIKFYFNIYYKISIINKANFSNKWIVMTASYAPTQSFINLLKTIENWIIVVISNTNNIKINNYWKSLNFINNLVYLTLKEQIKLGYEITKYLEFNSYSRKNIGYLYAIQHGAKEIYEIDENIIINNINDFDINLNNNYVFYGIRNDSKMINPYNHFGERNIWPRGYRIEDIGKDYNNKFLEINSYNLKLKPLIYQGLINGIPDVDSIYLQTKIPNSLTNISFLNNRPLIYFPGNYIPINSKNTKYFYEIFPFLVIPTTINEKISDILRGYIIQYFAWRFNLDFNIPWLHNLSKLSKKYGFYKYCKNLNNILNNNIKWKTNLSKFLGNNFYIPLALSDFYYIPRYIAAKICEIFKVMYYSKIFLECAVPVSFGILLNF